MAAEVDEKRQEKMLAFFCRHLVALCVWYKHKTAEDAGQPARFAACSGTLIMIRHAVFLLTAGHVLQKLEDLRTCAKVRIDSAALADTFGWKRVSDIAIPFDLKNAELFYLYDEKAGLDFGVIPLDPHYIRLLVKNGMVALTEENWIHQGKINFDGYAVLGLPYEFTSERVSASGDGVVSPTIIGVKRLESAPAYRAPTRYPQFVGQLHPELPLNSMEGMSGGPIFGFKFRPKMYCWIVALQSSWNRSKRIIYGCDLPVLASMMTKWAEEPPPAA